MANNWSLGNYQGHWKEICHIRMEEEIGPKPKKLRYLRRTKQSKNWKARWEV